MVVMKLGVKESSEKRSRRQLLPTPTRKLEEGWMSGCSRETRR
jgi:hypothetical protein